MATITKKTSGNYQVQIRLSGLKPITKTFPTKTLATKFVREVEGNVKLQQALGKPVTEKISFYEVVNLYLEQYSGKDPNISTRLKFWSNRFGDIPMEQITEIIVDDGLIELSSRISGSTINRYKSALSVVFIFFIRHPKYKRLKLSNPVRKDLISTFKENPAKERFLTDDEQKRLLKACKTSCWNKLYLLVLMALTTGARRGELLWLKWSDIDFSNQVAILHTSKNGKPRQLPLTNSVINELNQSREVGNSLIFKNTVVKSNPDDTERPYEIRKSYMIALKEAEINNCRFHDLRHSAASNLAQNGATLLEIADVLGHSNTTITKRYAHLCIDHKRNLINRVMGNLGKG